MLGIGDKTLSGWDIMKNINHSLDDYKEYSFGSLYPALFRLSDSGFLESYQDFVESQKHRGKKRNLYRVTKKGKDALSKMNSFRKNLIELQ